MENASKALLMAGGVLIGILILSLAVYLFASFGAESRRIQKQVDSNQLVQYNAQYTIYEGREDITIYEIISVANLAKENNEYYKDYTDFENSYKVTVVLTGAGANSTNNFQDLTKQEKQALLEEYNVIESDGNLIHTFSCRDTVNIEYHSNGRISKITFRPT